MNARHYAIALSEALRGKNATEQSKVVDAFMRKIEERKHKGILPGVLAHLKRGIVEKKEEALVVAKKKDLVRARKEAGTKVGAIINPNLVGGWQHYKDGVLTDASYKRSLIELYRNITK